MKTSRGIVWGGLLVLFGTFWLLRNMNLIHIQWSEVFPYWPVLLILAGVLLLISRTASGASGGLVALLITLAVFGGLANKTNDKFSNRNWSFDWDDDDHDDRRHHRDREDNNDDNAYLEDRGRKDGKAINRSFQYEMEDFIEKATFNLEGGAGSFSLNGDTDKLFDAATRSSLIGFLSNTSINKLENRATVNLKMEEGNIKIKKGKMSNEAKIRLNTKPVWTVDMGIGAGEGDFDFTNYQLEKLKVSTGVADMDIKLGDKYAKTDVEIEAGVASVQLEIPKTSGCEMHIDGALNSKDLDGLEKISDGLYRTNGYENAVNKIKIRYEGGLTSFKLKRY